MHVGSRGFLLNLPVQSKAIPVVESRAQFIHALGTTSVRAVLLRHCSLFELEDALALARQRDVATYVSVDSIDGIHPDASGLRYLANHMRVSGIVSNHPRVLAQGKHFELETIQRIFALDSTGLETALESVDPEYVDLLDISPALVVPHIQLHLQLSLPLPFIASGLVHTLEQMEAILRAGALGVVVTRNELWE
jgi:glycerol uptake operon antiterminator